MSKTTESILALPGEAGWEIWTGTPATGFTLKSASSATFPNDLTDIPGGDLTLLFPVKAITAVPMRVASDDEALFADLAALHAERLGLRPDPMAGQLTDIFIIQKEPENTAILSVLLKSPSDADITPRSPKEFDLSARVYPLAGDSLAVWKELGRWVFALSHKGSLAYCQATSISSPSPDDALAREIRLALIQLSLQGIEIRPSKIHVWSSEPDVTGTVLTSAFGSFAEVAPRPAPVLPEPHSKLLPADVRAARKAALKKRNITLGIAAAAAVYVGLLGWLGYGLWKDISQTKKLLSQAEAAAPDAAAFELHQKKWDELALAIDTKNSPVDILYRVARSIPPNSGLRLRTAEISAAEIKLIGEAQQPPPIQQFSKKLSESNELTDFTWQTPPPQSSTRGWEFTYNATSRIFTPVK
ncbi:MAG TPA: hypothetical protein VM511_05065 [Luteolibacter sp.]|nr:hypothetical protein [Luteolibacter sp.]